MKKSIFVLLVLSVIMVLSGCQSETTYYRMFKEHKYVETSENFFEYEEEWMRIEDIPDGYKIIYSDTLIYTEVKNQEAIVYGLTCQVKRTFFGSIQTDCNEDVRLQLMPYLDATVIYEGPPSVSGGINQNIPVFIGLILIATAFDIFFGLMAFNRPFLESVYQFSAMLQIKYKDQPEHAEWYLDANALGYKVIFILFTVGIIVGSFMLFML